MGISRRQVVRIISLSLASLFLFACILNKKTVYASMTDEKDKKVILLDPGHGGYDAGASSKNGLQEKEVNLKICLKIKERLIKAGYEVAMTREIDKSLNEGSKRFKTKKAEDLYNRCQMKKDTNCDLFISIHQNIFPEGKYYGAQVWYSKDIESKKLAHIVQQNLKIDLDNNNNRVEKPAGNDYKILTCNFDQPSILIESGFLSNASEAEKLGSADYQDKIAASIVNSIEKYFKLGD